MKQSQITRYVLSLALFCTLVAGLALINGCGSRPVQATPTPTKTPRVEAQVVVPTATPRPTEPPPTETPAPTPTPGADPDHRADQHPGAYTIAYP